MKKPVQFGKYHLLDRINVGGMAEVFRAKAYGVEGFERMLAVKRILPNIAEDKEFISMFIDEAKIAVQLQHANICQIFDLGKVDDAYFIALEFVSGKDLRALFDRCKQRPEGGAITMPVAQACFVIMKVCEGLDYAHNKKDQSSHDLHLVHRDVSPQNIIISYDGEVKLIDFGIAKSVGKASKTQAGILKGKFGYMSPEQVRGLPLDRRSDVFSVGIVLYELLTGERLFVGETDFSTLEKVRNVEILPPSTYNRKIPDELERIVLKALAKDVDDRYQNAIDLHDDLQAFMYTAGEFYSRKDLAAWMRKTWVKEMQEEASRLDGFRSMAPPPVTPGPIPSSMRTTKPSIPPPPPPMIDLASGAAPPATPGAASSSRPPAAPGLGGSTSRPPTGPQTSRPPPPPPRSTGNLMAASAEPQAKKPRFGGIGATPGDLSWDEEELETHVYDSPKDASDAVIAEGAAGDAIEADEISGLHEVPDSGPNGRIAPDQLDSMDLAPDGAPVPARGGTGSGTPAKGLPAVATPAASSSLPPATTLRGLGPAGSNGAAKTAYELPPPQISPGGLASSMIGPSFATDLPAAPTVIRPAQPRRTNMTLLIAIAAGAVVLLGGGIVTWVLLSGRSGTLLVSTDPPDGVRVLIDDKPVQPDAAGRLKLDPGSYTLAAEREGYVQWRDRIDVKPGEIVKRRAELEPLARSGFTLISDPAGATATLDGKDLGGRTPFKVEGLAPGRHKLEVSAGGRSWTQEVVLEPGRMIEVRATIGTAVAQRDPPPRELERPAKEVERTPRPAERPPKEETLASLLRDTPREKPRKNVERPVKGAEDPPPPVAVREKRPKLPAAPPDETPPPTKPVERPAASGEGFLRLNSKPWTKIAIDGKDTGETTPQGKMRLGAGRHTVTLTNPQFGVKESFPVEIHAGETETVIKDLRPQSGSDE